MTAAEVRAVFERYGKPQPDAPGVWLRAVPALSMPLESVNVYESGGRLTIYGGVPGRGPYIRLAQVLAALAFAEDVAARAEDDGEVEHVVGVGALTTYRSTR